MIPTLLIALALVGPVPSRAAEGAGATHVPVPVPVPVPVTKPTASAASRDGSELRSHPPFGDIRFYRESPHPSHVVLFASGDGGWNQGVLDMARALAARDALVVGFSTPAYLAAADASHANCIHAAGDLEELAHGIERELAFPEYVTPMLVGYSSGATLVYAALAQAPPNTFLGAISLGFCPDLENAKAWCHVGNLQARAAPKKGWLFDTAKALPGTWIALQGEVDQVCSPKATGDFVAKIPAARLVSLPRVGHGYSVERNWMPQYLEAFAQVAGRAPRTPAPRPAAVGIATGTASLDDLPLDLLSAKGAARDLAAVIWSGDGGWAGLDRSLGQELADRGIAVTGVDSLRYFWQARTPESATADLVRILRASDSGSPGKRFLLIGYSFGADVLPFLVSRLPPDLRGRVAVVGFLGLSPTADFEMHLGSWFGQSTDDALPTKPEVEKLRDLALLCVMGSDEKDSTCLTLPEGAAKVVTLPGGHHFGGDVTSIADELLSMTKH